MPNQRMFHGHISANALADQLAARFHEHHTRAQVTHKGNSALVQIGSKHGTPVTVHINDTEGGVLITMSQDRDWLDKVGDVSEMLDRAANGKPFSLLAAIPELLGELQKDNIAPEIWDAINDICGLTRALAGEENAPKNPKVCHYCQTANSSEAELCQSCGAALPVDLPRICPKCSLHYTADALFCQACGTRLING
jgi:ribosomal protein L40E